jgi:hypothetical protein
MSTFNKIQHATEDALKFVWGGLVRIFSPTDDAYPNSGVQPYEGDPPDRKNRHM